MKKNILLTLLSLLPVLATAAKIEWVYDIEEAKKLAKKENKVIMVDVHVNGCGFCKRLDNTTYVNKEVVDLSKRMINAKLNAQTSVRSMQFANKHNIGSFEDHWPWDQRRP